MFDKGNGWLSPTLHSRFRELMLHAAAREGLLCPVYCLMPDHMHLVWMGLRLDTDQLNGMAFLRTYLEPVLSPVKFQPQAHDAVLHQQQRTRNAFAKVCFYIANNPLRAELVEQSAKWPYTGCIIPGYPKLDLFEEGYWSKFWKLYVRVHDSHAGDIVRTSIA